MTRQSPNQRNWGAIVAIILVGFLVLNLISFIWFPFLPWFEQRQAGEEVMRDQIDAEVAIQNYEWFREQWHDIDAKRAHIENLYDEEAQFHETYGEDPQEWSRQAETRHTRLHQRITANKNQLENMVAEYNARSDQAHRAMFKCHLPYKVDERFAITGPPGSGEADQPNDTYVEGADPDREAPPPEECDGLPEKADA